MLKAQSLLLHCGEAGSVVIIGLFDGDTVFRTQGCKHSFTYWQQRFNLIVVAVLEKYLQSP